MTQTEPRVEGRKRASLFWNTVANYFGRILSAVLNVAFVPLYLRLLGSEAYGLIGLFLTLQGLMQLFDLGLSATMNRELARFSIKEGQRNARADLVATFEAAYWGIGLVLALAVGLLSPFARNWLHSATLTPATLVAAVALMGVVVGVNWPVGLYSGGLLGLERHVALNSLNGLLSLVRYGGAALVLWLVHCDIIIYFVWQLAVSVVQVFCLRLLLWREIGHGEGRPRVRASVFKSRKKLIFGISGTYAALILFTQLDKVVVSKFATLSEFSCYSIAWTASGIFYLFYSPISASFYPRITNFMGQSRTDLAVKTYELGSILTAILVLPIGAILCVFSREILSLWLAQPDVVGHTHLLLRCLAPSAALASLLSISNMLQWAQGWTRIGFWTNAVGAAAIGPVVAISAIRYGVLGAAFSCSLLRIVQTLAQTHLVHKRFLPARLMIWYRDVAMILLASFGAALSGKFLVLAHSPLTGLPLLTVLILLWLTATLAAALACAATSSSVVSNYWASSPRWRFSFR